MKINFDLKKQLLEASIKSFSVVKGDLVLSENTNLEKVLFVTKGKLRLFFQDKNGQELSLHYLLENDICLVSASCAFGNQNFPIFVKAKEDTDFILIGKDEFYNLVSSNKDLLELVLSSLGSRVLDLIESLKDQSFLSLRQRLIKFLLKNKSDFVFKGSHELIAQELGTSREVVSRAVKSLVSIGYISSGRENITILKPEEMLSLCD